MRRYKAGRRSVCCRGRTGGNALLPADPDRAEERRRNASRGGRARGNGELADLKKQLKDLASDVLDARVDRGSAAVVNQILNTVIRTIEQERKMRELEEMAQRLEALEEVLKARKAG
jgi:hypothetical protein